MNCRCSPSDACVGYPPTPSTDENTQQAPSKHAESDDNSNVDENKCAHDQVTQFTLYAVPIKSKKGLRLSDGKLESDRPFCPQSGKSNESLQIEQVCSMFTYACIYITYILTLQTHLHTIILSIREQAYIQALCIFL